MWLDHLMQTRMILLSLEIDGGCALLNLEAQVFERIFCVSILRSHFAYLVSKLLLELWNFALKMKHLLCLVHFLIRFKALVTSKGVQSCIQILDINWICLQLSSLSAQYLLHLLKKAASVFLKRNETVIKIWRHQNVLILGVWVSLRAESIRTRDWVLGDWCQIWSHLFFDLCDVKC